MVPAALLPSREWTLFALEKGWIGVLLPVGCQVGALCTFQNVTILTQRVRALRFDYLINYHTRSTEIPH